MILPTRSAAFFRLRRLTLPQLIGARPLTGRFTQRFLREAAIFPFDEGGDRFCLAVGDPSDVAAQKAAELVLGAPAEIAVASFEDIATALVERLGPDNLGPDNPGPDERRTGEAAENKAAGADESIDSLRDLASGAPVVRAVNDLLEKAVELRASDIHIEPLRNGLAVRMRVDGLLRVVPAPAEALPQALISRIKILAGLNIAETAPAAGRGGAPQRRAARNRHSRGDDADPARRIGGHPIAAARPRPARDRQARLRPCR